MDTNALLAISPLDGRYQAKVENLQSIFSEFGLMKFRIRVEIRWLIMLAEKASLNELSPFMAEECKKLEALYSQFSLADAERIKHIEESINHDVKAIEYFIKERLKESPKLTPIAEFVHFGCTSEDINNLAYGLMLTTARQDSLLPILNELVTDLKRYAKEYASLAMLAHTHGQPASPTTVGKELANVAKRLERQIEHLNTLKIWGKLNGATGNFNALHAAYPEIDWITLSQQFVLDLGLHWNAYTTQIEPHDGIAEFFSIVAHINTILIDFNRDMWAYISIDYFKQHSLTHEVGSSTMPHKVNPIDFENAEGNLGVANALAHHFISKLPISRWQRDLSDSTVLRNMGVAIGHSLLAYQSTLKGIQKIAPNTHILAETLDQHWEVLAEAVQMVMRRYRLPDPYEQLKALSRGKPINQENLHGFIKGLPLPDEAKQSLLQLTPATYLGYAVKFAKEI